MALVSLATATRSDTYTVNGNGVLQAGGVFKYFALQVNGTGGTPSTWDMFLEGSLDGVNFTTILEHKNGVNAINTAIGATTFIPYTSFRTRLTTLALGGSATAVVAFVSASQ